MKKFGAIFLAPAYGRRYKDVNAMLSDWEVGRDFRVLAGGLRGKYTSIRDLELLKGAHEEIMLVDDISRIQHKVE